MTRSTAYPSVLHVLHTLDPASGGVASACGQLAAEQSAGGRPVRVHARYAAASGEALQSAVAGADVVHLHGVWDAVLFHAARATRRAGKPYVISPHGMLDSWSLAQKRWKKRLALALGYRRMLDRAAGLIALHSDEAASFKAIGLRVPVAVVPNGVSLVDDDLPPAAEFRAGVPGLADAPYVLFLGRLHHKKGLDYLADAFSLVAARVPDARLVVVGPDEGARADFTRRVAGAGVTDRVHVVGPLFGRAKWAALAGAACFCLPSRQEGFSVAVLEALAARVPVVVSPECHFPEVEAAGAGVVAPLDPAAVADAITSILADPDRGRRMGEAGRRLVEGRYTWAAVAELMDAVYARAVGARA